MSHLLDHVDEELELELEDEPGPDWLDRKVYLDELFRMQRELVRLQDWVIANKLKVVAIFEGRDAAGKGGAIKRITQRLNPRVCRTVALPAPNDR
jgi:polyphosphate kinase 2 (PPK2 family)